VADDLLTLFHRLAAPQWWALGLAIACHATAVGLHTLAWRQILARRYGDRVRWRHVFGGYAAGSALNAVVPARAGLLLKLYILKSRIAGATYPALLTTLAALAAFDVVVTVGIAAWAMKTTLLPDPARLAGYRAFIGRAALVHPAATAAVLLGALALLAAVAVLARRRVRTMGAEAAQVLAVLARPRFYATRVLPIQILNWVAQLSALGFYLHAFGLPATPRTVLVAQAAKSLAVLIPFTPSGAGAQFALLMLAFGRRFSIVSVSGLAVGMRLTTTAFNVAVGAGALMAMLRTLRWGRLLRVERRTAWQPQPVPVTVSERAARRGTRPSSVPPTARAARRSGSGATPGP
jgi:uncharacterized membrane protein YbhN (UPF0104 family)